MNWLAHTLLSEPNIDFQLGNLLADLVRENPPLTNAFVAEFAGRLQGQGSALVFAVTWLEQRLAEQG